MPPSDGPLPSSDAENPTQGPVLDDPAFQIRPEPRDQQTVDARPLSREAAGAVIGRYKLLQKIGEGGFGTVWMAEQREPVVRKVALKIIKLGMDTREVVARFEAERQALAMMDHTNIARVLDGGATESGRPFFVMELVQGVPITQFCDDAKLPPEQRLELFIDVCAAIQHAHQKGIIHRDIKPSNILVTLHGDKPVPKVIDFGIAKATQQKLTDKTLFTQFQQFIGTPIYMSPEQASLSGLDIDTRSDIYSLGVLLYELLTGKTPFDPKSVTSAAHDEIRRIIREQEPPRPSTRLSTMSGEELSTLAARRNADVKKLGSFLKGDLDLIVMKAIEKDRARRYDTANALAQDIQRFMANEPVTAVAPSVTYKLTKFFRRNRAAAAVISLVTGLLIAGIAASTWQAVRATKAESAARTALDAAKSAMQSEGIERKKAQAAQAEAVLEATRAKRLLAYTSAQYMLGEKRIREAFEQAVTAHGLKGNWEDRALIGQIVDAARSNWRLVSSFKPPQGRMPALHHDTGPSAIDLHLTGAFAGPDAHFLAVPAQKGIDVYDLPDGKIAGSIAIEEPAAQLIPVGQDRLAAIIGKRLRIYTIPELRALGEFQAPAPIVHIAYDPAQNNIAAASVDGVVQVWPTPQVGGNPTPDKPLAQHQFKTSKVPRVRISFSPSGDAILFNHGIHTEGQTRWQWKTDETENHYINSHVAVFVGSNESTVLGENSDTSTGNTKTLWLADFNSPVKRVKDFEASAVLEFTSAARHGSDLFAWKSQIKRAGDSAVQMSADDYRVALVSDDGIAIASTSRRTLLATETFTSLLPHLQAPPQAIAFDGRRGLLALNCTDHLAVMQSEIATRGSATDEWSGSTGRLTTLFWCLCTSRQNMMVVEGTGAARSYLRIYAVPFEAAAPKRFNLQFPPPAPDHFAIPWGIATTPDNQTLAILWQEATDNGSISATYKRKRILIYKVDPDSGKTTPYKPIQTIEMPTYEGIDGRSNRSLFFTPDQQHIAFWCSNGKATIYNIADGSMQSEIATGSSFAVAPDGSLIAGGSFQKETPVTVWNTQTAKPILTTQSSGKVRRIAIAPDNKTLYVGWENGTLESFDIATGQLLKTLKTRLAPVAISPAGDRFVAFVSDGNTVSGAMVLADLTNGQTITVLNPAAHLLNTAYYSPDGERIAAIADRYAASLFRPLTPEKATQLLDRVDPANFFP